LGETSFLQCATQYGRYWLKTERQLVSQLASPELYLRLSALQRAAGYFRIARNFPTAFDTAIGIQRLMPVLNTLDRYRTQSITRDSLCDVIEQLRRELGVPYGGRDFLSAATKLLWLLHRDSVIIFDSQARAALGTPPGDFPRYFEQWFEEYERSTGVLTAVCVDARKKMGADADALDMTQEWFRRRVFDTYLWNRGAPASTN
jgi:hypothetical protein